MNDLSGGWCSSPVRNSFMSLRGDIPQSKKIATYLSGIFVDGNVYNSVIVAAFLKNGFVDGQVPVLPHLPGIDSKRKGDIQSEH